MWPAVFLFRQRWEYEFLIHCNQYKYKEEPVKEVEYDEDGCYAPDQYMAAVNSGDVFQDYSFFIGNK